MADRKLKQKREEYAAAKDAEFGPSTLVLSRPFNAGTIVPVPGPAEFGGSFNSARGTVFGWPEGHGAICACLDCKKAFKLEDDHDAVKGEGIVECPDCGAVSVMNIKDASYEFSIQHRDGAIKMQVPRSRNLYVSQGDVGEPMRAKDSIASTEITFGRPVIRDGRVRPNIQYGGRVEQITYEPGRVLRTVKDDQDRPVKDYNGQEIKPVQGAVVGIPPDREKNLVRTEWQGGFLDMNPGSASHVSRKHDEMQGEFMSALYTEVCVKKLGLPPASSEADYGRTEPKTGMDMTMFQQSRMVNMVFQYPGVVEREITRVNTNLSYAKEPVSPEDAAKMRYEVLSGTMDRLQAMDAKLAHDLHMCKDAKAVEAKLRYTTFGTESEDIGQHIKPPVFADDAAKQAFEDRKLSGKFLKKQFNIDPYATAANARTCQKLGVTKPDHVQQLFRMGQEFGCPGGIVPPSETQDMVRFGKLYCASRPMTAALNDFYPKDNDRRILSDTAMMYAKVMSKAEIAVKPEDLVESRYRDTLRQMHRYFRDPEHSFETALEEASFQRAWGDKTRECVQHFYDQYQLAPDVEPAPMFRCRDDKAAFSAGHSIKYLHDEFALMDSKLSSTQQFKRYEYTPEEKAQMEWSGEELNMHVVESNTEACLVGQSLNLCTGSTLEKWDTDSYLMIVEKKDATQIGCIEVTKSPVVDPDGMQHGYKPVAVAQIKAADNHTFPGYRAELEDWMRSAGIVDRSGNLSFTSGGKKDFDEIGKDVARYGNGRFANDGPIPVEEVETAICSVADIKGHFEWVANKEAERAAMEAAREAKKAAEAAAKAAKNQVIQQAQGTAANVHQAVTPTAAPDNRYT